MSSKIPDSIIDGTNLTFRYWHGIPPQYLYKLGKSQVFNNVIRGWFNMVARLTIDKLIDPNRLIVVFDGPGNAIKEYYPDYKANRKSKPEGFKEQVKIIHKMNEWLGIHSVISPDEADPAIAYLVSESASPTQVVSTDKDLMQLVDERVTILRPETGSKFVVYREIDVVQKMGVIPRLIPQLLAIQGDASDNVPGVRGIGPKGAVDLINRYGNIQQIIEHVDELSKNHQKNLRAALPSLPTYLRVVKLVPLEITIRDPKPNSAAFLSICDRLDLVPQIELLMEAGLL